MTLPMLRILPPPWDFRMMMSAGSAGGNGGREPHDGYTSDKYESIRRLAMLPTQPPRNPNKPFTSFRINDILSPEGCEQAPTTPRRPTRPSSTASSRIRHPTQISDTSTKSNHKVQTSNDNNRLHENLHSLRHSHNNYDHKHFNNHNNNNKRFLPPTRIVRPWDASPSPGRHSDASSSADDEEINVDDDDDDDVPVRAALSLKDVSPLDALMEMANKTFQGLETSEAADAKRREQAALFGKHATPKKRRKSRTAFTNQQIYELEKRFLYQKYLTPADRDEIAQTLGLTNAQVITWFQNRRAKLKRDLEELKNDVVATKQLSVKSGSSDHEFSIDSDSEGGGKASSCRSAPHSSLKRYRSESKSPEAETSDATYAHARDSASELSVDSCINSPRTDENDRCESPEEIVVDDHEASVRNLHSET
ncbi:homeobox protein MOX-2-like [Dreissena polymorpha]|uniref:Homeobox domain-containing protein n=1 Tax=Dreissena polymorpha TaxID=45954 RepID=A0A9D4LUW7_DREPO|nr:homeobox protein MOX-2-like [Dreissena polymorpha]KAH3864259.1 hypothetical protein DPMN_027275 [Dreissena polymorpha]